MDHLSFYWAILSYFIWSFCIILLDHLYHFIGSFVSLIGIFSIILPSLYHVFGSFCIILLDHSLSLLLNHSYNFIMSFCIILLDHYVSFHIILLGHSVLFYWIILYNSIGSLWIIQMDINGAYNNRNGPERTGMDQNAKGLHDRNGYQN